jgi:hypothetical protein
MAKISLKSLANAAIRLAEISARTVEVAKGYDAFDYKLQQRINEILAEQGQRTWDTKGGEIGANWGPYDLVDTGELRESMTNPNRIKVKGFGTTFSVESDVDYAVYVNERWGRIYGMSQTTKDQIEEAIRKYVLTGIVD